MSIVLNTPLSFSPGHGAEPETYNEVMITRFDVDIVGRQLSMTTRYGNTVNGKWVAGKAEPRVFFIENTPDEMRDGEPVLGIKHYDLLAAAVTQLPPGSLIYDELGIALYAHLMATVPEYAGTLS